MKIIIETERYSPLITKLADEAASMIHAKIVDLHLRALARAASEPYSYGDNFLDYNLQVRRLIQGIPDPYDRKDFTRLVRSYLNRLCAENGTDRTCTSYVAKVLAHRSTSA